jgi:hypothetical protein
VYVIADLSSRKGKVHNCLSTKEESDAAAARWMGRQFPRK